MAGNPGLDFETWVCLRLGWCRRWLPVLRGFAVWKPRSQKRDLRHPDLWWGEELRAPLTHKFLVGCICFNSSSAV